MAAVKALFRLFWRAIQSIRLSEGTFLLMVKAFLQSRPGIVRSWDCFYHFSTLLRFLVFQLQNFSSLRQNQRNQTFRSLSSESFLIHLLQSLVLISRFWSGI